MNDYAAIRNDSVKAQAIRSQYVDRKESKIEQLKKLDRKVKSPGRVFAYILGLCGSLLMGAGMSFVMVLSNVSTGLILSIPGMFVAVLAYPVYKCITSKRKQRYAAEVFKITDEVIG